MAAFWNKRENNPDSQETATDAEGRSMEMERLQAEKEELLSALDAFKAENKALKQQEQTLQERMRMLQEWENKLAEREQALSDTPKPLPAESGRAEEGMGEVLSALKKVEELLKDVGYKDKIIKELHDELQKRNRDFYADIAKPYLKNIIRIHERLSATYKSVNPEKLKECANGVELVLRKIESDKLMVEDMLNDEYDMVYYEPAPGSLYQPKEHMAIQSLLTDQSNLAGTVAECRQGGFRDLNTGKVFKSAVVSVYKYEK